MGTIKATIVIMMARIEHARTAIEPHSNSCYGVNLVRSSYAHWAHPQCKNLLNSIQLTEVKELTRKKGGKRFDKIWSLQNDTSWGPLVLRLMLNNTYCGPQEGSFCMLQVLSKRFPPLPPFFFSSSLLHFRQLY